MYIIFYLLMTASSIRCVQAQNCPIKKGYAYQRSTIPGNIPRRTLDESGKQMEAPVKKMNTFFIYVETGNDCNPQITSIWIGEKVYHITQEEVINIPVVIYHSHPGSAPDTLVKQTTNKVFRIQPGDEWQNKPGKKIVDKKTGAKIIIEYRNKSRTDYYKIQDIKKIAPIVLQ